MLFLFFNDCKTRALSMTESRLRVKFANRTFCFMHPSVTEKASVKKCLQNRHGFIYRNQVFRQVLQLQMIGRRIEVSMLEASCGPTRRGEEYARCKFQRGSHGKKKFNKIHFKKERWNQKKRGSNNDKNHRDKNR